MTGARDHAASSSAPSIFGGGPSTRTARAVLACATAIDGTMSTASNATDCRRNIELEWERPKTGVAARMVNGHLCSATVWMENCLISCGLHGCGGFVFIREIREIRSQMNFSQTS